MIGTDENLKEIDGLRWRMDEDGSVYAHSIKDALSKDRFFLWGNGVGEIYYARETKVATTYAARRWRRKLRKVVDHLAGDFDGLIRFELKGPEDIPMEFFKSKLRGLSSRFKSSPVSEAGAAQESTQTCPDDVGAVGGQECP